MDDLFVCVCVCYHLLYHFSSFLLPVVQKKSKKWKIAIFLEFFFSFFYHVFTCFIIFASSGANMFKT